MTRLTRPQMALLISVSALVLGAWPMAALTPTLVPQLGSTGGGPQNGAPWMVLLLVVGYCVAGLGLVIREQGRRV